MSNFKPKFDHKSLQELFEYSENSPSGLIWKVDVRSGKNYRILTRKAGDTVGSLNQNGGWVTAVKGKHLNLARVVYMVVNSVTLKPSEILDHIDGDRSNNKISNLRIVNFKLNNRNKALQKRSKTGITGVSIVCMSKDKRYARAKWTDTEGKSHVRYFSIDLYGESLAISMAKDCRYNAIEKLNTIGAGYTNRHLGVNNE